MPSTYRELKHLSATEQDCVHRYIQLLRARLAHNLFEIRLFGSAARGYVAQSLSDALGY